MQKERGYPFPFTESIREMRECLCIRSSVVWIGNIECVWLSPLLLLTNVIVTFVNKCNDSLIFIIKEEHPKIVPFAEFPVVFWQHPIFPNFV